MSDSFQVAQPAGDDELDEQTRHEMVAAQLRGERKAAGQDPEVVVAAVSEELEGLGLEPDQQELQRRYDEEDPELPISEDHEQSHDHDRDHDQDDDHEQSRDHDQDHGTSRDNPR